MRFKLSYLRDQYNHKIKKWPLWLQIAFVYFFCINVVYFPIYFQYFQQDEWFYLSYFHQFPMTFLGAWGALTAAFHDPQPFSFHFTPIATFLNWLEFKVFGAYFPFYAGFSLVLHTFCSVLVYGFAMRITQNRFISFVAGLFFALTFSHSQATTWMAAHLQTQTAALSVLLSINYFFDYLQTNKRKQYFLSIVFFLVAVLTKETGAFLILFLPILALMYKSWRIMSRLKLFYLSAIAFVVFRIFVPPLVVAMTHTQSISGISSKNQDIFFSLYYTLSFFLKVLSESFIPLFTLNSLSMKITDFGYPQYTTQKEVWGSDYITFIQSAGTDIALYLTGFLVAIVGMCIFFAFSQNKRYKKALLLSFYLILLAILPLTFLAGWLLSMMSYFSIVESRHLYLTNIGVSIFVGFAAYWFYLRTQKKFFIKTIVRSLLILVVLAWGILQIYAISHDPSTDSTVAADRKAIVRQYHFLQPKLDDKTVFYSESNVALYGFGDYMLPFQNNPAQVIVGTYGIKQPLPEAFYKKEFLFKKLTEEWYQEYEGVGLGYYLNKKHLLQAVIKYNIRPEDIVAVKYDGRGHFVYDITNQIRDEVRAFLQKRDALKKWKYYEDKNNQFSFFYPPEYVLQKEPVGDTALADVSIIDPETGESFFRVEIRKIDESLGISNLVETLQDAEGNPIEKEYRIVLLLVGSTDQYTSVIHTYGTYQTHYFRTFVNDQMKKLTFPLEESMNESKKEEMKQLLENLEFRR